MRAWWQLPYLDIFIIRRMRACCAEREPRDADRVSILNGDTPMLYTHRFLDRHWYRPRFSHRRFWHVFCALTVLVIVGIGVVYGVPRRILSVPPARAQTVITVNPGQTFQTIDAFSASFAGLSWLQYDGWHKYSTAAQELYFDTFVTQLGLTMARHNTPWAENIVGGVSTNDNADPWNTDLSKFNIPNPPHLTVWRPGQSPAYDGGTNSDLFLLKGLRDRGVNRFFLTTFFYPDWLLGNTCSRKGSYGGNLDPAKLDEAAEYLYGTVRAYREKEGIPVEGISLINEPEYCDRYSGADLNTFIPLVKRRFACIGAPAGSNCVPVPIKVMAPEHSHAELDKTGGGISYVADLYASDLDVFAYHQYVDNPGAMGNRLKAIAKLSSDHNIPNWQVEVANGGPWNADTVDEGITTAADIHNALVLANSSVWSGFMDKHGDKPGDHNSPFRMLWATPPDFKISPKMYAMKKYSRYIPPGSVRIGVSGGLASNAYCLDTNSSLCVSAFKLPDDGYTIVITNTGSSSQSIAVAGISTGLNRYEYAAPCVLTETSNDYSGCDRNLGTVDSGISAVLPGKSVTTFTTLPFTGTQPCTTVGPWQNIGCTENGCAANQMHQTRIMSPPGCDTSTRCVSHASCASDPTPPTVTSFTLRPRQHTEPAVFDWSATDNQGLARIELWQAAYEPSACDDQAKSGCAWSPVATDPSVSGPDAAGTFTHTPLATSFYGLHAVDTAGNAGYEPSLLKVTVATGSNLPPVRPLLTYLGKDVPGELCGNGAIDPGEQCDGGNLNNQTCQTQGFQSGTLACNSAGGANDCRFNTSQCVSTPACTPDLTCTTFQGCQGTCNTAGSLCNDNPGDNCPAPHFGSGTGQLIQNGMHNLILSWCGELILHLFKKCGVIIPTLSGSLLGISIKQAKVYLVFQNRG